MCLHVVKEGVHYTSEKRFKPSYLSKDLAGSHVYVVVHEDVPDDDSLLEGGAKLRVDDVLLHKDAYDIPIRLSLIHI